MIVPLFFERLMVSLVGLMDTLIISFAGEAAVSGVSLITQINNLLLYVMTALASGGAVIISQYLGRGDDASAGRAASQLLSFAVLTAACLGLLLRAFDGTVLNLLYGRAGEEVMQACLTYLRISVLAFPAIAAYNAGAAVFNSLGKTKVTLAVSGIANVINTVGNLIGVLVLKAGVAGVAWPTFLSQLFAAAAMVVLCFREERLGCRAEWVFSWNPALLKRILGIAVPTGAESGVFHFVKIALSGLVACFGTVHVAAYGVAQTMWSLGSLGSSVMSSVFTAVIGRCCGAGEKEEAERWFRRLMRIALAMSAACNFSVILMTPALLWFYPLGEETKRLVWILVLIHNSLNSVAFPFYSPMASGLRAAGDVRYVMVTAFVTSAGVRLAAAFLLGLGLGWGSIGVAAAMCCDWIVRVVLLIARFRKGKWKRISVI